MKTRLLALVALLLTVSFHAMGQHIDDHSTQPADLGHGYRGFAELDFFAGGMPYLSTTHGYQFNPRLFVGAGVGYGAVIGGTFPGVQVDVRFDAFEGKHSPYIDLRLLNGAIFIPTVGYRYRHLNVAAKYWFGDGDDFAGFSIGFDFGGRKHRTR